MISTMVALVLVIGADPQPTSSVLPKIEMPKLVDGLAPLKPLSSQAPLIRPVLSTPLATAAQPSLNLPALPKPNIDLRVKECERKPDIVGGTVADSLGRPHKWLVIEDPFGNTVHAPGLGNKQGVPGANGQTSPDCFGSKTYIRNHSDEVPRSCKVLPAVDPTCVISKTPYDQYVGGFWPYINDCNTFTQRTINACQTPSLSASPLFNSKPVTVWDKVSLLPQADAVPKYRLIDVDLTKSMAIPPTRKLTVPKPK